MVHLGCATWRLPKTLQPDFPGEGTHLARYAARLPAVELNSSFYRRHRRSLYEKWASEVPEGFRFCVKLPRGLTHDQRLRSTEGLEQFLGETAGLGGKLGAILVQLPPSLTFEAKPAAHFLEQLRAGFGGRIICEPRHASWFADEAEALLKEQGVSRAAVDPPPADGAENPGGDPDCVYLRLHGSPRRFYSAYSEAFLEDLANKLREYAEHSETWCIFNNTASDAGLANAMTLLGTLDDFAPGVGGR
ncbi:DUF72 domain-containing protein [Ectothiorhodospiraceae bacterium WFHF3C12]|nr:DUF72 domain-containing protein [Ectothiorhodospiraceae bacterium WFHF3C12]